MTVLLKVIRQAVRSNGNADRDADATTMHRRCGGATFGETACAKTGQPYVVPIYYAFEGHYLYSFSLTGQKIDWMRSNPMVCVEVNEPGRKREWRSVIIKGLIEELPHLPRFERERGHAWSLISRHADWWEPGNLKPASEVAPIVPRHVFYRIQIKTMTGRQAVEDAI